MEIPVQVQTQLLDIRQLDLHIQATRMASAVAHLRRLQPIVSINTRSTQ